MKPIRTIKFVARQTGLTVHTIRVWEKRYGAVRPERASNNRRLYTEEDVERLRLLREATMSGHAIGQIARASLGQLQNLVRDADAPRPSTRTNRAIQIHHVAEIFREAAINVLADFDTRRFLKLLDQAAVELGSPAVLQNFVAPLAERIGELWRNGELTVAHEHFASNHIAEFLRTFARPYSESENAPHLVLATPTGQLHELGAAIAAAAARTHGWRTTYLGAALPIEEFAGAVHRLHPRAVGLSIIYPPDDRALRRDLLKLPELLPKKCPLLIGGRSAEAYLDIVHKIKATHVPNLLAFFPILDRLQYEKKPAAKKRKK
ncbi:MAG: MerR family transcriptional regulator [Verrucomicrobiota bacterium]|nr:MerR family transcriptional regulator [Verrucomicrobiota bacterium]